MMSSMAFKDFVEINPRVKIDKGTECPFVEMGSVIPGRRYVNTRETRIFKGGGSKFMAGDILFARITPCLENGKIAQFYEHPGMIGFGSTEFFVFRSRPGISNQSYVFYLANSNIVRQPAEKSMSGASGRQRADIQSIAELQVPTPPLPAQRKIASILSAYDDLIENNLRRTKILEEMAQSLYREWFVKYRFPGHEKTRMVDSPLGKIPDGWEVMAVGDTFEILGGGTPSKKVEGYWADGDIMWYVPSDLTASKAMFMDSLRSQITELGLKKSSARLFPPFSVMMTSRATLGVIAINTTEACTNQGFITCLPNERFPLYNLYHWLMENVETFVSLASGAIFKEITKGVFNTIELMIPDQPIARAFENIVKPLAEHVLNLQRRNANLKHTRDLLLPKLITGELDVCDLNISTHQDLRGDFSHE